MIIVLPLANLPVFCGGKAGIPPFETYLKNLASNQRSKGRGVIVQLFKASHSKQHAPEGVEIPVLCRFSQEQGVWNAVAVDLPVAVFGHSFEEAQRNLGDAIITHLEALQEVGLIDETIQSLRCRAKDYRVAVQEMGNNEPLVRFSAAMEDHKILALV